MAFLRFYDAAPPGLRLEEIFTQPDDERTEQYVTGKFG